jgi:hypothetical protein
MCLRPPILWLAMLCLALPFGISLPPSLNFATSPSPVGSGAWAQGKALAFIGVADDAAAVSHNLGWLDHQVNHTVLKPLHPTHLVVAICCTEKVVYRGRIAF